MLYPISCPEYLVTSFDKLDSFCSLCLFSQEIRQTQKDSVWVVVWFSLLFFLNYFLYSQPAFLTRLSGRRL